MSAWDPYQPTADAPWNLKRVVHLHRRVVFGACRKEIQRDLQDDPQAAVTRVLDGTCRAAGVPDGFVDLAHIIGNAAVDSGNVERLKAWWIYRCLFSPHPLEERLTLMWHNHFATSNLKINDLRLMKQQNETLRKHAFAPFGELFRAMLHDPALLEWLDAPTNRVGMPNENLGRETLELFTLGIGNYSEQDVREASRALTGWTVRQGEFRVLNKSHDAQTKTILNQTGNWDRNDLIRILLEQPGCAQRIAWRLMREFFGENVVDEDAITQFVEGLSTNNLDIRWGMETILRSQLFFSEGNLRSRICDPLTYTIATLRALECWRAPPRTLVLAEWLRRFGQDLFYPPNVSGWPGGRTWLSSSTVVARTNYATMLVEGQLQSRIEPLELDQIGLTGDDPREVVRTAGELFFGEIPDETVQQSVAGLTQTDELNARRCAVGRLIASPLGQLH